MFSLGEGEGPVPGGSPDSSCCSGGLPSHIWKVGAKNRAGEGYRPPRLAAFALTTRFTLDNYLFPARAWISHGACSDWLCSGSRGSRVCCMW